MMLVKQYVLLILLTVTALYDMNTHKELGGHHGVPLIIAIADAVLGFMISPFGALMGALYGLGTYLLKLTAPADALILAGLGGLIQPWLGGLSVWALPITFAGGLVLAYLFGWTLKTRVPVTPYVIGFAGIVLGVVYA